MLDVKQVLDRDLAPIELEKIAHDIVVAIDDYCVQLYTEDQRKHLGASVIGDDCARRLWYMFRWAHREPFSGRMLRLFNRGHREEQRLIEYFRGIGFEVWDVDPNTGEQFRIYGCKGHYGGSLDSACIPNIPQLNFPCLLEFKTYNTKQFVNLKNQKTLVLAKPKHYEQMCEYGVRYSFKYGIYCAVNKNDDDLHIEILPLDPNKVSYNEQKAHDVIFSPIPPPKLSLQSTHFECKMCAHTSICHSGAMMAKNCRSCRFATPVDGGQWHCARYEQIIPSEFIPKGCGLWEQVG